MPLPTGPGPVAKSEKKAWSRLVETKSFMSGSNFNLCDKYNAYPQPKAKIMKFS